jgi:hypothetical protein
MPSISQHRPGLCHFTFADNRHCRALLSPSHAYLCTFHARKEAQSIAAQRVGRDLSTFLSHNYITACDLTAAMGHLFGAVAQGHLKPRTANTLAYVGQTIAQTIRLSQHEFVSAFGVQAWRAAIRDALTVPSPATASAHSADEHTTPVDSALTEVSQSK